MDSTLASFTDVLDDEICDSQPISLSSSTDSNTKWSGVNIITTGNQRGSARPCKGTGQRGNLRSTEEIDPKYRDVFTYEYFNLVQSKVIDDALYSDKSIVVCAPTGSGKTVVFEMAIVQLLMELEDKNYTEDFKIIYMAPVKALCTERLTEWYPKFTKFGLLCIEATGDTDVDFSQLQPYKIIITTPEKWDMLTRRWRDHRSLVEVIKLFLIDEVHILNDESRGPVLEAVVSRMKTIESSAQSVHRIEKLQNQLQGSAMTHKTSPSIRFVAVSATVSNPEDVAEWLGTSSKPAVFHKFGDECRPVKLNRIVEGYPCPAGTSIFKFDIILNYKLWPIIQKYHCGKPTLIFCNTRKSVTLTAETLSRELTINFNAEQKAKLTALASTIKNKKLQSLVMNGVGCHHAGLLYEERQIIERAFRNRDLPILITTTTLAMGVNLPAHLVIIKNTQQYVNGTFQEYSISTVLQMVGRAGRPQFDTDATAVIMTRLADKGRYQALVGGCEPLQSFLHKRLPENLNSEAALGTVGDVAQCVQWLRSTFLYVRAARDPKRYLGLPQNSPHHLISKKIEELCVKAMNGLASSGLITMDEASCIESTEAGRLMSIFYLDVETMKLLMRIEGTETLERLLTIICESHELSDMHLRIDERRCLNTLNRNYAAPTIRFPMKGKISTRQMKLNCVIQAVLGCLAIPDPSLNQEAMKIIRIADRVCKCLVAYVTHRDLISRQPKIYSAVLNSITLAKCITAHLWENSPFVSKQLKGIGPTLSTLLATAGKVNFMLLEESHPRDLERIMNKGAPAGNVLRRQISLLPKYQLSMMPRDESTVLVQLDLLNQSVLAENVENLTAGGTHKCYIVVGDSTNHLLLLASFKDTDLLRVYDGTMTHEIRRQHNYEHKIFAHCISSTFVGLDVQSEYLFKDLNGFSASADSNYNINEMFINNIVENENDSLKKRKRKKTTTDFDKTPKEKKKRGNAIIENFKCLKKTFETHSKTIKENINLLNRKQASPKNEDKQDEINKIKIVTENDVCCEFSPKRDDIIALEDIDSDNILNNDEKINQVLTEIEIEMSKRKSFAIKANSLCPSYAPETDNTLKSSVSKYQTRNKIAFQNVTKQHKSSPTKSNYSFIDLLEKNLDLSDEDDKTVSPNKYNGFSDTIKSHINKYIQKTKIKTYDPNLQLLLVNEDGAKSDKNNNLNKIEIVDPKAEEDLPTQEVYPHYEIKEILHGQQHVSGTEVNSKEERCKISSPEEFVVKGPSNVDNNYNTTQQNNDVLISMLMQLDTLKETNLCHVNQTNSQKLCALEEKFQKPIDSWDAYEKNSNNIHVDCRDSQTEKNVLFSLSENETVRSDKNGTMKIETLANDSLPIEASCTYPNNINFEKACVPVGESKSLNLIPVRYANPNEIYESSNTDLIDRKTIQDISQNLVGLFNDHCHTDYKYQQTRSFMIEDNKRSIIPKQSNSTHFDESQLRYASISVKYNEPQIISESLYSDNYSKLLNSWSNNSIFNKNKHEYVKKYSFSTRQIDIQTKESTECSFRVIKDIKLDLNITAIVSSSQPRESCSAQSDTTNSENIKKLENNLRTKSTHDDIQSCFVDSQCTKPAINKHSEEDKINKKEYQVINSSSTYTENAKNMFYGKNKAKNREINCLESTSKDLLTNSRESIAPICNSNNQEITHEYSVDPNGFKQLLGMTMGREGIKQKGIEETENISVIKTRSSAVQNVLQKYRNILGKETINDQNPVYSAKNKNNICKISPPKSKKPFKISNINERQATIPETFIHCLKVDQHIPTTMNIINNEATLKKNTEAKCYLTHFDVDSESECSPYQSISDIDLKPLNVPAEIYLEPKIDYNIDQSMFDPRTLLQCTVDADNEDIIAPPPQFCDFHADSQNSRDSDDSYLANNSKNIVESMIRFSTDKDFNCNENIFEENCTTNLTPSREIETWTLDEQDYCEDGRTSLLLSPVKSFTVVRRNNSKFYNTSGNTIMAMPRQAKLEKFKFTHKNKLKKLK